MMKHNLCKTKTKKIISTIDFVIFLIGVAFLLMLMATSARLNISADSVDYYAILQQLTPEKEEPIVQNLHFTNQRSPGYCLIALIPYFGIQLVLEPLVKTNKISDFDSFFNDSLGKVPPENQLPRHPGAPFHQPGDFQHLPDGSLDRNNQSPSGEENMSSEFIGIPPFPLQWNNLLFNDFYIEQQNSWFQWKLSLSLLITSIIFLLTGIIFNALLLKHLFPSIKGYTLIVLFLFLSPVFIKNVIDFPLYATLTVYGLSSAFFYFFLISFNNNKNLPIYLTGLIFGFLVLTRMELVVLILPIFVYLIVKKNFNYLKFILIGGIFPFIVLVLFNLRYHGNPIDMSILKGDINQLTLDLSFIYQNLFHPESGLLYWTPLLMPGLLVLASVNNQAIRLAGASAFVVLLLYLLKIPVMFFHLGEGTMNIGGISVNIPPNAEAMRFLIRSDINRYAIVLIPFAIVGIRIGLKQLQQIFNKSASNI